MEWVILFIILMILVGSVAKSEKDKKETDGTVSVDYYLYGTQLLPKPRIKSSDLDRAVQQQSIMAERSFSTAGDDKVAELVKKFSELTPAQQKALLEFLKA
jgi:hypothetical protein